MSKNRKSIVILIIALLLAGIFIKAYYVNYTDSWERQHDVISFGAEEGHAAYIEYLMNNRQLPDFDPRTKWGFFQPPLHHIVSAAVLSLSKGAGLTQKRAEENTQIPTCIYMILLSLLSAGYVFFRAKGDRRHGLKDMNPLSATASNKSSVYTQGLAVTLAVIGLHPMFIFFSGSINNDALALFLSLISLIIAAKWFKNPSIFTTILLALVIGLSMIAKLTGGLTAVPIGILMLIKIFGFSGDIRSDGHAKIKITDRIIFFFKKYFAKILLFSCIVFPLGLSYSIYNKIRWGMPLNYIPPVGEQFPADITLKDRLLTFATDSVFTKMISRGDAYDEYSLPLMIVKTSLFGEYSFADLSRWMKPISLVLFVSAIILIILALFATIYITFVKKNSMAFEWKILLFGTYITYFAAYLYFALSNNNFSAEDFRYAAICIVCEGVYLGIFTDEIKNEWLKKGIVALSVLFAMSSLMMFLLLGIKS